MHFGFVFSIKLLAKCASLKCYAVLSTITCSFLVEPFMNYLHPLYKFLADYKPTTQIFPSGSKHGLLTAFLARRWPDLLFVPSSHVTHGDSKPSQSRAPSVIPKPSVISNMIIGRGLPFSEALSFHIQGLSRNQISTEEISCAHMLVV